MDCGLEAYDTFISIDKRIFYKGLRFQLPLKSELVFLVQEYT